MRLGLVDKGDYPSGDCWNDLHGSCNDHWTMSGCSCSCHPVVSTVCTWARFEGPDLHDQCSWEPCQCPCHHLRAGAQFVELRRRVS